MTEENKQEETKETNKEVTPDKEASENLVDYADNLISILVDKRGLTYAEAYLTFSIATQLCMDELVGENTPLDEEDITTEEEGDGVTNETP